MQLQVIGLVFPAFSINNTKGEASSYFRRSRPIYFPQSVYLHEEKN